MKSIYETFDDEDHAALVEIKERYNLSWRDLILTLIKPKKKRGE